MNKIVIVDYELGNILSVKNAFKLFDQNVTVSNSSKTIEDATHLIVPGVGSFKQGMQNLQKKNLDNCIKKYFETNRPILGICLGLQLFFSSSEEFGNHEGLNLIEGEVVHIKKKDNSKEKLPVIGWRDLDLNGSKFKFDKKIKKTFYFDHSFMVKPRNSSIILGTYIYDEFKIPSLIETKNFIGCQFHPEKSGKIGLNLINQFLNL